jgi:hypothetical protein
MSDRKLRLFAVACCQRIGHLLVETAERFADGGSVLRIYAERRFGDLPVLGEALL